MITMLSSRRSETWLRCYQWAPKQGIPTKFRKTLSGCSHSLTLTNQSTLHSVITSSRCQVEFKLSYRLSSCSNNFLNLIKRCSLDLKIVNTWALETTHILNRKTPDRFLARTFMATCWTPWSSTITQAVLQRRPLALSTLQLPRTQTPTPKSWASNSSHKFRMPTLKTWSRCRPLTIFRKRTSLIFKWFWAHIKTRRRNLLTTHSIRSRSPSGSRRTGRMVLKSWTSFLRVITGRSHTMRSTSLLENKLKCKKWWPTRLSSR